MPKRSWRGRRLIILAVCIASAFAATATVLSVSLAATSTSTTSKGTTKAKPKSTPPLTKSQVIALVKQYAKAGPTGAKGATGAVGAAGTAGAAGAKGENGLKGETGAKGENGTKGEEGAKGEPGADGAVAGLSASQPPTAPAEGLSFTAGTIGSPTTVLSKSLPTGNYLASAKVQVTIVATGNGGEGDVGCELLDTPTTGSPVADVAGFFSATDAVIPTFGNGAATTLPLEVAVSTSSASTLSIECWVTLGSGGETGGMPGAFFAEASNAHIQAVQTTSNS